VVAIDDALTRLVESGTYARLFTTYFPGAEIPPETLAPA
jgi:ABC-type amino acid transport substrate-binding protein